MFKNSYKPSNYHMNVKFPRGTYHTIVPSTEDLYCLNRSLVYIPNQWRVFSARSDWLLKPGVVSAIHLPPFFWNSSANFFLFLRKKELFGAGQPLVLTVFK